MAVLTLRSGLLPAIDALRGIPGILGLQLYTVQVAYVTWSGSTIGQGTKSVSALQTLKVAGGTGLVTVRQVTQKDIINSNNFYQNQDLKVGQMTPPYTGSAKDDDQINIFDPPVTGTPTEVLFFVTGPGYSQGAWFTKVGDNVSKPFSWWVFLRKSGYVNV